jgi:hypothetical protein
MTATGSRLCSDTENALARGFALAYLLTADAHEAEAAVSEAADCWNPEIDSEEALVLFSAVAAARLARRDRGSTRRKQVEPARFPRELAPITGFDALTRGCFVLRILLGVPLSVCAQMLGIGSDEAEKRLCAMLRELPQRVETEQEIL